MRAPAGHHEERDGVRGVEVDTTLDGAFLENGVIAGNHRHAAPAAGPADAADHVRDIAVERVEVAAVEARAGDIGFTPVTAAFFESDRGGEAVATGEGVGDLVGVERTVGNETVVGDARRIAGEGGEQRVGLADAEAAKLDVGVVQVNGVVMCVGEATVLS